MARKRSTKKLPPDPENMNDERAEWAEMAVRAFIKATRTDREDALCDLLADLMHWADREKDTDFDTQLGRGRMHYREETMSDDADDPIERMYSEAFAGETDNDRAKAAAAPPICNQCEKPATGLVGVQARCNEHRPAPTSPADWEQYERDTLALQRGER